MTLPAPRCASFPDSRLVWREWFAVSLARANREQSVRGLAVDSFPLRRPTSVLSSLCVFSSLGSHWDDQTAHWWLSLPLLPVLHAHQSP
jgi:hypothetical protein